MNSKCEATYDTVFSNIIELLKFLNPLSEFKFKTITTDNEIGLINSLNKNFPKVERVEFKKN